MATLQIHLFGDFQILYQGAPLGGFDAPRLHSLLAFLLFHQDAPQSRKHIAFSLWQDSSEQQAHGNLRTLVHRLRKALPDADRFLLADAQTLQWRADAPFTLDVAEFQALTTKDAQAAAEQVTRRLASAVALYRGELLPACYDEWLIPVREELRERFADALAQLVVLAEAAGDDHAAIRYARRLLGADPLGEDAYRKLMVLYARTGDRANMVRVYQTCVAVLKRELDAEPSALTRETFERLRRADTSVERPVVSRVQVRPNLPVPLTSFVGRARELAAIRALLDRARLVTLTGVGGGGKTRLAIQAAHEVLAHFPDGVWFVDLAPLSDAADVPRTCAAVFGLREQAGAGALEMLTDYVGEKELLLVFDNCEHLLTACSALAQIILQAAPRVRILATSRVSLNLPGEALLVVPPLSLPDTHNLSLESLAHSDAVQLFTARAGFVLPSFSLSQENMSSVAQICRHLDGIPLAIELAAARVRALTPQQIAARLDDALAVLTRGSFGMSGRHQTMRAVLDWSDALLSEQERRLFLRLSVFAGGFTLDTAERVCSDGAGLRQAHILDLLSDLIDKSLVTSADIEPGQEARYRLLEPVRQYAHEKLALAGEEQTMAARHLDWCIEMAEQMQVELGGAGQAAGLARLEREQDNLRGALEYALRAGQRTFGLRLATALERFWLIGGHPVEGRDWFRQLLAPPDDMDAAEHAALPVQPTLRARALAVAGTIAWRLNDFDRAEACLEESLHIWEQQQNQVGIALSLRQLGDVARTRADYARSIELLEQSVKLWRELGDKNGIANVLSSLGATYSEQADYAGASALYQEALVLAQEIGDTWLTAMVMNNLGVALRMLDPDRAETLFRQSLALRRSLSDRFGVAISIRNLAELALARQDWGRARALFSESLSIYLAMRNEKGAAECLVGLAWVENAYGRLERAARFLAMNDRLREAIHAPLPEDDRGEYEDLLGKVRAGLDPPTFDTAWAEGRKLTFDQGVAEALSEPGRPA